MRSALVLFLIAWNSLRHQAPTEKKQAYMNKLTTKKQINANANLMGPRWRKK